MLKQSRHFKLFRRDRPLNAHKVIGQSFLKVVEESSEVHVRNAILQALRSAMDCWSIGVLECWFLKASLHYSITPVLRFSKPASRAKALCVYTLAMRLRYQ